MTHRPGPDRHPARHRWLAILVAILIVAGCGTQNPTGSAGASSPVPVGATAPAGSSGLPVITLPPASAPPTAAPAATPTLHTGFQYSDVLKIQVNSLAVRRAPKRSAALVHGYDLSGPAPIDYGLIRLDRGDYVSVELGPVPIGNTVWYLVWGATATTLHPSGMDWYAGPSAMDWYTGDPGVTAGGPGWIAASVGGDAYATLHRRPELAEIEGFLPLGLNAAGLGNYESAPQPRHDGFLFEWAAAAPASGTACALKVSLVPADADVKPEVAINTTTSTVKVSPLTGSFYTVPWLPAPEGSWTTFTVRVTSTCNWAIRLTPLHHD